MIVAAHQPAYLPWLGYLHKIACADVFVLMDDLQYEAQNYQNRNRVKVNNGAAWLTVPLFHSSRSDRICDKTINNCGSAKEHWQRRSWATLTTHYRRAPFFSHFADELEQVYTRAWSSLVALDLHLTQLMLGWLGIVRPIVLSSSLALAGEKSARIVHMCQRVGADTYLSGCGASTTYIDGALFSRSGLTVSWQRFEHPEYVQRYPEHGFIPRLSALDLILNCGPKRSRALLDVPSEVPHESVLCA